jgi:hypothetical protein
MALAVISVCLISASLIRRSRSTPQGGIQALTVVPGNNGNTPATGTQQQAPSASAPASAPPGPARPGWVSRLNAVTTLVMAAAIALTLIVSYATLRSQLDNRNATAAAAARAAKLSFASKVAFWWTTRAAKTTEAILHVQNDNQRPADVWAVYLGGRVPGHSLRGRPVPPFSFVGQVPPCKAIQVRAPFAHWPYANAFTGSPLLARGDLLFTDPSGLIWERGLAGTLRALPGGDLSRNPAVHAIISSGNSGAKDKWSAESAAPSCG